MKNGRQDTVHMKQTCHMMTSDENEFYYEYFRD
jgi:hypothetical protein